MSNMPRKKDIDTKERIVCVNCRHYYVTWDYNASKGCKAYGFKSSQAPSMLVKQSTGADCLQYERKNK
jgi:hypothetical protein